MNACHAAHAIKALCCLCSCVSDGDAEELLLGDTAAMHSFPGPLQPWLNYHLQAKAVNAWDVKNRAVITCAE